MHMPRSLPRLRRLVGLLLATMQLGFVVATLTERSERAPVSHVEPDGTRMHAVHDEAFCPGCQGSLTIGRIEDAVRGGPVPLAMPGLPAVARTSHRAVDFPSLHGSRAPPVV